MEEQKRPAILTNFEIKKVVQEESGKTYYMLLATNNDKTIKVAHLLDLENNLFSLQYQRLGDPDIPIRGGTCVCSGCSEGCDPTITNPEGNFKCSTCVEGSGCSKSVTVTIPQ